MPAIEDLTSRTAPTERLRIHLLEGGPIDGISVVFLHGNLSTGRFWDTTIAALPEPFRGIAPDLRGFGRTDPKPLDATRGLRDFADDLHALFTGLGLGGDGQPLHLVGWSAGGSVAMQYAIDHAESVASVALVDPMSPYGFGGTRDASGTPCWPDYAGSGAGTATPEFVKRLREGDRTAESDFSPRNVMRNFYFRPPFQLPPEREEQLLDEVLLTVVGDDNYPGDAVQSPNWPGVRPGVRGMNNAISAQHCDLSGFAEIDPKPPVLWIRGADDQVVSDLSMFDFGALGKLGAVPGWPGEDVFPPQPMIAQLRSVLDAYRAGGGTYREEVLDACGHSPHLEQPDVFRSLLVEHLRG